jgi:hypothetical protein
MLSCVMIMKRSCDQLYLLNFVTLQLIITTSITAKGRKMVIAKTVLTINEIFPKFLVLICIELIDDTSIKRW